MVKSGAMTPGAITEAWQAHDGSAWVDVRAAKIVKRAAFEAAALDDVVQIIGNVTAWVVRVLTIVTLMTAMGAACPGVSYATRVSVTAWALTIVVLMAAMGAACTGVSYATRMALNVRDG
jgi:hypothetical protein